MTANHDLHDACAKYVLDCDVHLADDGDIISLIYFMRPGKRKRWRYLRALVFDGGPVSSVVAAELARVIPRAIKLERLTFQRAEATLSAHPDLALALAALPSVRHVRIENGYQHTCRMLEAMQWPLESVSLNKTNYTRSWRDSDKLDRLHPARLLQNSRTTLKFMKCQSWTECSDVLPTYPVYPEVHTLIVEDVWCPRSAQWAKSFPDLKRLTVGTIEGHFMEDEGNLQEYAAARRRNMNEYAHTEEATVRTTLESFAGGPLDLYLLGLPCRIRNISISVCEESLNFFTTAMEVALPTYLNLRISHSLLRAPATSLPVCLLSPGLRELERLSLSFSYTVPDHDSSMDEILELIFSALLRLSLREFSLTMDYRKFPYCREGSDDDGPLHLEPPGCPVEGWFTNFDPKKLAQEFVDLIPSLERVNLAVGPASTHNLQAFLRKEGGVEVAPDVVSLPDEFRPVDPVLWDMHYPLGV
ncbi:hypothetical protein L226DRAFT_569686 [Lentinus tigrinus ALCF2SS1-7]|uniref:F-box domain-containing protein n=1 Tax=Lentinus tigrinus ALCF2SS1-6 TaxID=1328759 RepID=A0A5C2SKP8_9APHY|nr:hypothetical protein L227DRAFT_607909 [Lentinus tigrinus ALCF2SS1-6]RPD76420.1 hypothetical protein L226DRAFT_569686 [Lentinus tigrinus ALCF2SS1-7]